MYGRCMGNRYRCGEVWGRFSSAGWRILTPLEEMFYGSFFTPRSLNSNGNPCRFTFLGVTFHLVTRYLALAVDAIQVCDQNSRSAPGDPHGARPPFAHSAGFDRHYHPGRSCYVCGKPLCARDAPYRPTERGRATISNVWRG